MPMADATRRMLVESDVETQKAKLRPSLAINPFSASTVRASTMVPLRADVRLMGFSTYRNLGYGLLDISIDGIWCGRRVG